MYPMSCWDSPQTLDPVSIPVIYARTHGSVNGEWDPSAWLQSLSWNCSVLESG